MKKYTQADARALVAESERLLAEVQRQNDVILRLVDERAACVRERDEARQLVARLRQDLEQMRDIVKMNESAWESAARSLQLAHEAHAQTQEELAARVSECRNPT